MNTSHLPGIAPSPSGRRSSDNRRGGRIPARSRRGARFWAAAVLAALLGGDLAPAQGTGSPPSPGPAARASAVTVSDTASLKAALADAAGGETIRLAPGEYDHLALWSTREPWANFQPPVTLVSADPGNPARLGGLALNGVSGLTFDGIDFDYRAPVGAWKKAKPFRLVEGTSNITIRNARFIGDFARGVSAAEDGYPTGYGLVVLLARDITVENSEFLHWDRAAIFGGVDNLRLRGNLVHSIHSDGFDFAQVRNVLIEDNHFRDFTIVPGSTAHRDMIQFWTTNTEAPSVGITIRGNILMSGEGSVTQSIFMRNEMVDGGKAGREMFYRDILIEDNVIWNAHLHGITVGETDGLTIRNNTLLQNAFHGDHGPISVPRINPAEPSENVTVTGNIVGAEPGTRAGWTVADNLVVQRRSASLPNYYGDLFVNALNDGSASLADLQALPAGLIEKGGYGAARTRFRAAPAALTARARHDRVAGEKALYAFDGSLSSGPGGPVAADEARFRWDFGDGSTAEGVHARHAFARPGTYMVALEVTDGSGARATARSRVVVEDPLLLDLRAGPGGMTDHSSYAAAVEGVGFRVVEGRNGDKALRLEAQSGLGLGRNEVRQIYDLDAFTLSFGVRADAPGEILRIHAALKVLLNARGQAMVVLINADGEEVSLVSPAGLLDGDWHDVAVTFDGIAGIMAIHVDGVRHRTAEARGRTQPARHWGLYIGGGGGRTGFTGEIDRLEFRSVALDADSIAGLR